MSRSLPARLGIVSAAALALGVAGQMRAQEKSEARSATPTTQDAIAGAKKDFDSIKSARDAALLPKGGLPRVAIPELPGPSTAPANSITKQKIAPGDPKSKSANWLVDAMEKQASQRDLRGPDSRLHDRKGKSSSRDKDEPEESGAGGSVTARERNEMRDERNDAQQDSTAVVINPLTRYLGEWMTPQDYALLKPGLTQSIDPGADVKNSTALNTSSLTSSLTGNGDFAFGGLMPPPPSARPTPRENPYLSIKSDLPLHSITPLSKPVTLAPVAPSSLPAMATPPAQTPLPQTKIPEFAKPPTDDKYFKQLKRF